MQFSFNSEGAIPHKLNLIDLGAEFQNVHDYSHRWPPSL